jgi:hypothetical protein
MIISDACSLGLQCQVTQDPTQHLEQAAAVEIVSSLWCMFYLVKSLFCVGSLHSTGNDSTLQLFHITSHYMVSVNCMFTNLVS